jgi:hypothetical protein
MGRWGSVDEDDLGCPEFGELGRNGKGEESGLMGEVG